MILALFGSPDKQYRKGDTDIFKNPKIIELSKIFLDGIERESIRHPIIGHLVEIDKLLISHLPVTAGCLLQSRRLSSLTLFLYGVKINVTFSNKMGDLCFFWGKTPIFSVKDGSGK